jgi:4-alpha-glucanotransferase
MGGTPQPAAWGILPEYWDSAGNLRRTSAETSAAILAAMGAEGESPPDAGDVIVLRAGERRPIASPGEIFLEDGASRRVEAELPVDLPLGYHLLREESGRAVRVIVSPGACFLDESLRTGGLAVQLYALRSARSWGIGDLGDLRRLAAWSRAGGARMLLLSPLHAAGPGTPQQASPYFPSSRQFRNPIYLRLESVPGARRLASPIASLASQARDLNRRRRIDRDAVWRLKLQALELLWRDFRGDPGFSRYCARQGPALEGYATFCALAERHGASWRGWPSDYRHPDGPAVAAFAREARGRVDFHRWLQWLLEEQLERAAAQSTLIADLAIGVDPDGADAWAWQDQLAPGVRIGAPPDAFAPQGQDWGLPPFDPWRLRAAAYEPFVQVLRSAFRHSGGIRLDHVMGLFRLYWIPRDLPASEGAYVRYPSRELLDVLALESHRARAFVVGEDLGTVEDQTREELARRRVLSYRLLWFEERPPPQYPPQALAAVTTHDLPTIAGAWTGADLRAQEAAGIPVNQADLERMLRRLRQATGLDASSPLEEVILAAYRSLASSPCRLVAATMEDALAVEERPNMPGTGDSWPNWSLALPSSLEAIIRDPRVSRLIDVLKR